MNHGQKTERNKKLIEIYNKTGTGLKELGLLFGISKERTRQILTLNKITKKNKQWRKYRYIHLNQHCSNFKSSNSPTVYFKWCLNCGKIMKFAHQNKKPDKEYKNLRHDSNPRKAIFCSCKCNLRYQHKKRGHKIKQKICSLN